MSWDIPGYPGINEMSGYPRTILGQDRTGHTTPASLIVRRVPRNDACDRVFFQPLHLHLKLVQLLLHILLPQVRVVGGHAPERELELRVTGAAQSSRTSPAGDSSLAASSYACSSPEKSPKSSWTSSISLRGSLRSDMLLVCLARVLRKAV